MLDTRVLGLRFYENGLNCHVMTRAFSLAAVQPDWADIFLAAYYWNLHYPIEVISRDRGETPLFINYDNAFLAQWFGAEIELFKNWDGTIDQLDELRAQYASVVIPTDKSPMTKRFANAGGEGLDLVIDTMDDDIMLFGNVQTLPLLSALDYRAPIGPQTLTPWVPGGAFGFTEHAHRSIFVLIGDTYSPFSASVACTYSGNLSLRKRYSERFASLQLLDASNGPTENPKSRLIRYVRDTLSLSENELWNRVSNKAEYTRQTFLDRERPGRTLPAEETRQTVINYIKTQSLTSAALFLALGLTPCPVHTIDLIERELHAVISLWHTAHTVLEKRDLPSSIVSKLVQAEQNYLGVLGAALGSSLELAH
jgi:hypothetical protein